MQRGDKLTHLSCEAPVMICDAFGTGPPEPTPYRKGEVLLERNCGIDLDTGCKFRLDDRAAETRVDLWFIKNTELIVDPQAMDRCALKAFGHKPADEEVVSASRGRETAAI